MARKRSAKPRSFYEPWLPAKSVRVAPRPNVDGVPEEAAASILDAWERVDRNADWIIWGSGMVEPSIGTTLLTGKPYVADDRGIIAVRRRLGIPSDAPTNQDIAERIAECVNALAWISDPVSFVSEVRSLLLGLAQGEYSEDPRTDPRVISLLSRCIPSGELESHDDSGTI